MNNRNYGIIFGILGFIQILDSLTEQNPTWAIITLVWALVLLMFAANAFRLEIKENGV